MPKINGLRIVNLTYNVKDESKSDVNSNKIIDEVYKYDGLPSTMLLQNGGGKTVMIQMMMSPFVSGKKRDLKGRKFTDYFVDDKNPTYILIEHVLDNGEKMLTGIGVKKSRQSDGNVSNKDLDIQAFVHIYESEEDPQSLKNLKLCSEIEDGYLVTPISEVVETFRQLKRVKRLYIDTYDLSSSDSTARKNYFNKLSEYGIIREVFENVIRTINLEEGGLSAMFDNCKTESDLIRKWFLKVIDEKLNVDGLLMKDTRMILKTYFDYICKHQQIIDIVDSYSEYKLYADKVLDKNREHKELLFKQSDVKSEIKELFKFNNAELFKLNESKNLLITESMKIKNDLVMNKYKEVSSKYHKLNEELEECVVKKHFEEEKLKSLEKEIENLERSEKIQEVIRLNREKKSKEEELAVYYAERDKLEKSDEELRKELEVVAYNLMIMYDDMLAKEYEILDQISAEKDCLETERTELLEVRVSISTAKELLSNNISKKSKSIEELKNTIEQYKEKYIDALFVTIEDIEKLKDKVIDEKVKLDRNVEIEKNKLEDFKKTKSETEQEFQNLKLKLQELNTLYERNIEEQRQMNSKISELKDVLDYFEINHSHLFEKKEVLREIDSKLSKIESKINLNLISKSNKEKEKEMIEAGVTINIPRDIMDALYELGIEYKTGLEYLTMSDLELEEKIDLVSNVNPLLPYSIVVDEESIDILKKNPLDVTSSFNMFVVSEANLRKPIKFDMSNGLMSINEMELLFNFNQALLDEKAKVTMLSALKQDISRISSSIDFDKATKRSIEEKHFFVQNFNVTASDIKKISSIINELKESIHENEEELKNKNAYIENIKNKEIPRCENNINVLNSDIQKNYLKNQYIDLFEEKFNKLISEEKELQSLEVEKDKKEKELQENVSRYEELSARIRPLSASEKAKDKIVNDLADKADKIKNHGFKFENKTKLDLNLTELSGRYVALDRKSQSNTGHIQTAIDMALNSLNSVKTEMNNLIKTHNVELSEYEDKEYIYENKELIVKTIGLRKISIKELREVISSIGNVEYSLKEKIEKLMERCKKESNNVSKVFKGIVLNEGPAEKESLEDIDYKKQGELLEEGRVELQTTINTLEKDALLISSSIDKINYLSEVSTDESIFKNDEFRSMLSLENISKYTDDTLNKYSSINNDIFRIREDIDLLITELSETFSKKNVAIYYENINDIIKNKFDPDTVEAQLVNCLETLDLLKKLNETDLRRMDREKEDVINTVLSYVNKVHTDLKSIDKNSTIKLNESRVKMLEISPPEWDQELYKMKVTGVIESVLNKLRVNHEQGENATLKPEDILNRNITTEVLYDSVVGIDLVEIKIRKLESAGGRTSTTPITWSKASINSGGEGFATAFIVLVSLLSYMGREEEMMGEREETGKVLIMDNPFGKMSSEHLVGPFMEIAKKYNTQLICFTAIKESQIIESFPNVYHLRLDKIEGSNVNVVSSEADKDNLSQNYITSTQLLIP